MQKELHKKSISGWIICRQARFHKHINDLFIGSTEIKYIKLNTKTQNIFYCLNENLTTFLYTLIGGDKKTEGEKKFSLLKCIHKSNVIIKQLGFSI